MVPLAVSPAKTGLTGTVGAQAGVAASYNRRLHGRRTNGEHFDNNARTEVKLEVVGAAETRRRA